MDFTGLVGAGISKHPENEFYNKIGAVADNLRGTGLLSMNITSSGVSSRLTAGGINIGGSIYSLGKGFTADMALKAYRAGENMGAKVLEKGFLHGDQVFENTIWRILFGKDDLIFDADGGRITSYNVCYTKLLRVQKSFFKNLCPHILSSPVCL